MIVENVPATLWHSMRRQPLAYAQPTINIPVTHLLHQNDTRAPLWCKNDVKYDMYQLERFLPLKFGNEWVISSHDFILDVITYPCWDWIQTMSVKGELGIVLSSENLV